MPTVATSQVNEFDTATEVAGNDYLLIQTAGGVTKNTTKDFLLEGIITNTGGSISGDLVVEGDLTVNGNVTSVNTTQLEIEDNIITLNKNVSGAPTLDSGIEINRGSQTDAQLIWNETNDRWELGIAGSTSRIITENDINTINFEQTISDPVDVLDQFNLNTSRGAKWIVVVDDGTNFRISEILAVWNPGNNQITYSETSSTDLGDTSPVLMAVDISGLDVRLMVAISSGTWDFRIQRILI